MSNAKKVKRYHKSKQCFDINAIPIKFDQSTAITVDGSQVTYEGTWYVYYTINVKPNTDYYVNWEIIYVEVPGRGTILIADSRGNPITSQRVGPFYFNSGANTSVRVQIYMAQGTRATAILDHIMVNEGTTPEPYEPYDPEVWHDCAVKRYTSREEMNASIWQKTYKGNTLLKNGADIAFSINTGGGYGASVSTDQFYKDNCAIKLAANEIYSIKVTNNINVGAAKVVVRYLSTNEIITSVTYGDLPEDITLTPNVETYIYFGVDISKGVSAREKKAMINVIRQSAWHDIDDYVRQSGAWVQQ